MSNIYKAIHSDCSVLIKNFSSQNSFSFKIFCDEWKKIKFQNIFSIIMGEFDMIQTTIEIFSFCTCIWNKQIIDTDKIGAIYLSYLLYYKQPVKNLVKIDLSLKTWKNLKKFINSLDASMNEVKFIYLKLIRDGAFKFVEAEKFYGLEQFFNKTQDYDEVTPNEFDTRIAIESSLVNLIHKNEGQCSSLRILNEKYSRIKKDLNKMESCKDKLEINDFSSKLTSTMNFIREVLDTKTMSHLMTINNSDNCNENVGEFSSLKDKRTLIRKKAFQNNVSKQESESIFSGGVQVDKLGADVKKRKLCKNSGVVGAIEDVVSDIVVLSPVRSQIAEKRNSSIKKKKKSFKRCIQESSDLNQTPSTSKRCNGSSENERKFEDEVLLSKNGEIINPVKKKHRTNRFQEIKNFLQECLPKNILEELGETSS